MKSVCLYIFKFTDNKCNKLLRQNQYSIAKGWMDMVITKVLINGVCAKVSIFFPPSTSDWEMIGMFDRHVISLSTTSVISKVAFKAGSSKQGKVYSKLLAYDTLITIMSIRTICTHSSRKGRLHLCICAVLLCAVICNIRGPEESFSRKRLGFSQGLWL